MMKPTATTLPATFGRVFTRGFHATATVSAKPHQKRLDSMLEGLPPYPHPIQQTFKQSWFGLYGGKHIQFGNNVPDSRYKTRRNWLPNIRQKKLFSKCLNKSIELSVTASVLRTVDKVGGLDNYLLGNKMGRVKELGPMGWKLRNDIMATNSYKKRQSAERYALGIPKGAFDESPVVEEAAAEVGFEAEAEQPEGAPKVERDESGRYTL